MAERTWRIVTPEAVVLDLEAAGLASRALAGLTDAFCLWTAIWALTTGASLLAALGSNWGGGVLVTVLLSIGFFLLLLAWPIAWEVLTKGRSPGKMAFGIRVVTVEGAPIRFRHALVRGLVGVVELTLLLGGPALLVALSSRRFRRLGDHLAGTVVVRDRSATPPAYARRFLPYPGWEQWAASLDTTRLTPGHHRLVRSYLLRASALEATTRAALGGRILAEIATAIGLAPATTVALAAHDPVAPLTAIAASYQRRFSPDPPTPWPPNSPSLGRYAPSVQAR